MYINRKNEKEIIEKYIDNDKNVMFINVKGSSGFSAFLNEQLGKHKTYHIIYEDRSIESLMEKLIKLMKPGEIKNIISYANKEYGEYDKSFLSALASQNIPFIGEVLATINEGKRGINYLNSNFEILSTSIIECFREISRNEKVGILIDKAQFLNESDFDFIHKLSQIKNVFLIIAYTSFTDNIRKLKLKMSAYEELTFGHPNSYTIVELSKQFKHEISKEEAEALLIDKDYNIHKILFYIKEADKNLTISELDNEIISILNILTNGIEITELEKIISFDTNTLHIETDITEALKKLIEYGVIKQQESILYLCTSALRDDNIKCSQADIFYYKDLILKYYSKENSESISKAEICYELANDLNLNSQDWLERILVYKMRIDLPFEAKLISYIKDNKKLQIIAYTYLRLYTDAKREMKELKKQEKLKLEWEELFAVLLNRCRKHKKAEKKILTCLAEDPNNYVLKAFLISNYIHTEQLDKARKLYKIEKNNLKDTSADKNAGYFFRNCGAAFWDDLTPFKDALKIFENFKDEFGTITTMCNLVTRKMILDRNVSQSPKFRELENKIQKFGNNNMHIFYNDWAIAELLDRNFDYCHKLLNMAHAYSHSLMPNIFIKINEACSLVYESKFSEALNIIDAIEDDVEEISIERVKQKYYINKALVYYANNKLSTNILEKCKQYPDRYNKNLTYTKIQFYQNRLEANQCYITEDFTKCYCPCYLEYWYINPLQLLSQETIDEVLSI